MGYSVLVADDERLIRKAIIARLSREFDCIDVIYEAEDGQEAIDILEDKKVDIVLTDIRMPVVDGIGVVRHIYETKRNSVVRSIIISGYAEFEYAERAINYGVSGYLLKPIQKSEFIDALNKVIGELKDEAVASESAGQPDVMEQDLNRLFHYGNESMNQEVVFSKESALGSFAVMLVNIDGISYLKSEFGYEDKKLLKFAVMNVLREMVDEKEEKVFRCFVDDNVIGLVIGKVDAASVDESVQRLSVGIIHHVKRYLRSSVTVGVSLCHQSIGKELYDEANIALDSRYSYGKGRVYYYDDNSISDYFDLAKGKLSLIEKCIEKKERENLKEVIGNVFGAFEKAFKDRSYIRLLVRDVLTLVHRSNYDHLSAQGVVNQNQLIQEMIKDAEDVNDIVAKLIGYCLDVMGEAPYKTKEEMVKDMLIYMAEHFNEDISLDALASVYRLSSNYVYTMLKQETGLSYKQHMKKLRLQEAVRLLKETDIAISDISEMCGYNDSLYFSRLFKKELGMSPSHYRSKIGHVG